VNARAVHFDYIARRRDGAAAEHADEAPVARFAGGRPVFGTVPGKEAVRAGPLGTDRRDLFRAPVISPRGRMEPRADPPCPRPRRTAFRASISVTSFKNAGPETLDPRARHISEYSATSRQFVFVARKSLENEKPTST
jgi:hypothetical protein